MPKTKQRPIESKDLFAFKTISDVQISPDGARVAYVLSEIDEERDDYRTSIWVVVADGGEPMQFTQSKKHDSAPRWSPDGSQLAFLSDRDDDKPQLYVMSAYGGEPRKITSLDHGAGAAHWSPDGTRILFAARVPKEKMPEEELALTRWQARPKVITRAHYKDDGQGYTFDAVSRFFIVPADGGEAKTSPTPLLIGEGKGEVGDSNNTAPSWSPDGKQIAFARERDGIGDFRLSDIWMMDSDGSNPHRVTEIVGRATSPTWSPDGTLIACYGTDKQEKGLGDPMVRVWLVPVSGETPRNLTAEYDRGVMLLPPPATTPGPIWSADGKNLTFNVADEGNVHLVRANVDNALLSRVVQGERQVTIASAAPRAGRLAFCASDSYNPADVFVCAWDGSAEKRLTRVNGALLSQVMLPRVQRRKFKNPNGGTMDGWVIHPVTAEGPAPLLVDIHGGPHSFHGNLFPLGGFYQYVLASRGWAILKLNPTGSGSYGKKFAFGIHGRWGEHDLKEQLAAVDELVADGLVDRNRLAVTGYSYGGFMTAWTITHSDRFKAAVVGAPVVNQESMHGTSDIGMWFGQTQMKGDMIRNREVYRRSSPSNFVERVTTPTLLLHGEADDRCPITQSEEFFLGLIAVGKVPTQFVRYPGQSHLFRVRGRPSHRLDYDQRTIEWLEKYTLQPKEEKKPDVATRVHSNDARPRRVARRSRK